MFISPDGIKFYLQYINIKNNDKKKRKTDTQADGKR